ncbi:hypothetical protein C8P64_0063 [Christiangramia gaetbulicola]|uniref:UDP-glycosyltransferase n=1 Tax=Christiangramia gaetbulicola TaxID=703340 RepID=A0A2T6AJU1_9FLAO|nr:UDP-glycosyltransferase [Christiangramia gaetbulicola]PTX44093.1 hypothetical protein C8P64_0063 [Christiangramia gaetbulicola]
MASKKIFILLPDGVSLRNFAFTSFVQIGEKNGWEVIFWNQTPFDLTTLGIKEIKLRSKPRAFTDLLKRAKVKVELDEFQARWNDPVYDTYKFPSKPKNIKGIIKKGAVFLLTKAYKGEKGLNHLRKRLQKSERKNKFYTECLAVLKREKPDFLFCTSQRPLSAIAPLTAAQDLNIPTSSFIFSWDNLPKGTMVVETDYYFVWSEYMKNEVRKYYPFISNETVLVTGTPQFEPHSDHSKIQTRKYFFQQHNLNQDQKYILFSGDDKTTSPDDPQYLADLAEAVGEMNKKEGNIGIIFRRCPVDFSDRYDWVIEKFPDLIKAINPLWIKKGEIWNMILPTKEDIQIQMNCIFHSEVIYNLGSSMVFDGAQFNKPCIYINYDVEDKKNKRWSTEKIYKFIHFRSMPSKHCVIWLNSKSEISKKIDLAFSNPDLHIRKSLEWFNKINLSPSKDASERIWKKIDKIL